MWKSVLTLVAVLAVALPSYAQNYPLPKKAGEPQAICTGCINNNTAGEPNDGKPTWSYDDPLTTFVGRIVDSQATANIQHKGMRTARAGLVRTAYLQRNTAPPRIYAYIGLGTLGAYSLDGFLTKLAGPLTSVSVIKTGSTISGRKPLEKIAAPDGWFYPESTKTNWTVPFADSTERLKDFDFDDRGNIWVAYDLFGFGAVKDNNEMSSAEMKPVAGSQQVELDGMSPDRIFVLKVGSKYFVAVSQSNDVNNGRRIYDVTDAAAPKLVSKSSENSHRESVIKYWAKDDNARNIAVIGADGVLRIYSYEGYVRDDAPLETFTGSFASLSFDDKGTLWVAETTGQIRKMTPSGGGYNSTTLTPFPEAVKPEKIHARSGYVAVIGSVKRNGANRDNVFIFKAEGSGLSFVNTDDYFLKYYHAAPAGYAEPAGYMIPKDVHVLKIGSKTYVMYMAYGLGDVYQIEDSGPTLTAALRNSPATPNPYSQATEDGPFPGDPITVRATISNITGSVHHIGWNFGNPEAGSDNTRSGSTGKDETHQFTGLNTAAKVTAPKQIKATLSADDSVSDILTINLALPTARIAVRETDELVTSDDLAVLVGDEFVDASDGSVESHVATWEIDGTPSKKAPNDPISVGGLGEHTVELTASYGAYDEETFAVTSPYNATVSTMTYNVVPFLARFKPVTRSGSTVTYGAAGRFTDDVTVLTATKWNYEWTLSSKTGSEKHALRGEANIGTVPNFPITKSLLADGDVVRLELSVLPAGLPGGEEFATFAIETDIELPNPVIELTNCEFVNDLCSIKAVSGTPGRSTAGWQLSWTVKHGSTPVASGTGNPLATFKLENEGAHTVSVTETVFDIAPVTKNFVVDPPECGDLPHATQLTISADCDECEVNQEITFRLTPFHYTFQECDQIVWDFGDGTNGNGQSVKKKYTSKKTYTVKATVKNSANPAGVTINESFAIGGDELCPPLEAIDFTWSGPGGCGSGANAPKCKAGQTIVFTGNRSLTGLQGCDVTAWTIDGQAKTDRRPSFSFPAKGNYSVTLKVTNNAPSSKTVTKTIPIDPPSVAGCEGSATIANVSLSYRGETSGCTRTNGIVCQRGETIDFTTGFLGYVPQECDRYEFNFDDGSAAVNGPESSVSRQLAGAKPSYRVTVKVYNETNTTGVTVAVNVPFTTTPVLLPPVLTPNFPTKGVKGTPVTFTVTADMQATGWRWEFDGVPNLTKQNEVGTSSTITHTFTTAGRRTVRVYARNAGDTSANPPTSNKLANIDIEDVQEARFLLPIVGHAPGQAGSNWRTDVQIYNPDPNVGPNNPLIMQATFNGTTKELRITDSTLIYADFMTFFTNDNAIGPVIMTTRAQLAPQIWTRTYNQSENGTFGQFIPAIRLDEQGGGAAIGSGLYYLPGLRHDDRYRTNVGFVNPTAQAMNATVRVYDDERHPIAQFAKTLPPLQIVQFTLANEIDALPGDAALPNNRSFYLEIQVPDGQWVIAYASYIDSWSNDPLFVQALRENEVGSNDFNTIVVPGVGHVGQWRSDVTIFNPDRNPVSFDLTYYDGAGVKRGEAKSIVLDSLKSLQYQDIIKQGVFGASVPDGAGMLEIKTILSPIPNVLYPMASSRTYFDQPGEGTYGQGIGGIARSRANVRKDKPAIIPGVRSDENYYTNVGVTNLSDAPAIVTIKLLNPSTGQVAAMIQDVVQPNASRIGGFEFGFLTQGTIQVETDSGNIWAFASVIDRRTKDPEYVPATPRR